jgi:aryl-alcohol dehydrogenase-like predicted oxidoreductase
LKPSQYAVRWLLNQPGVTAVVVGIKRIEQLEELLGRS